MSSYLYRAFVDLLEGEDEDTDATDYDLDLQAAITASMQDSSKYEQHEINIYMHSQCKFALTSRPKRLDTAEVQSIIRQHRDQVLPKLEFLEDNREKVNRIDVRRSHIWSDTVEAFTRSTFSSQSGCEFILSSRRPQMKVVLGESSFGWQSGSVASLIFSWDNLHAELWL
jgi:hypothetical protein